MMLTGNSAVAERPRDASVSHSRSLKVIGSITPFDRYTSSYWHSIVTMALYCTVFEI